jgi:hypothetical protein
MALSSYGRITSRTPDSHRLILISREPDGIGNSDGLFRLPHIVTPDDVSPIENTNRNTCEGSFQTV